MNDKSGKYFIEDYQKDDRNVKDFLKEINDRTFGMEEDNAKFKSDNDHWQLKMDYLFRDLNKRLDEKLVSIFSELMLINLKLEKIEKELKD